MLEAREAAGRRRVYLDWVRGIAVLLMIEAHLVDSWVLDSERDTPLFRQAIAVGGMGTAFFLVLAGASAALSAGSKWRRSGDRHAAASAVVRHGLFIFLLAFLFRLQALILGGSFELRDLLKVDILNIMGPSIALTALIWRLSATPEGRALALAAAAAISSLTTPYIRSLSWAFLPDPLEAYIVPVPGLSNFVFFPWMGLAFAGGVIGTVIDATTDPVREGRLNLALGGIGAAIAAAAYGASYLPSPFPNSWFWTSSPAYFFIRVGLVTSAVAVAYAWTTWRRLDTQRGPILQLGSTSLFIYWIHVEIVYGLISKPLHQSLYLGQAAVAYVFFTALMLVCSIAKSRLWPLVQARIRSRPAAG